MILHCGTFDCVYFFHFLCTFQLMMLTIELKLNCKRKWKWKYEKPEFCTWPSYAKPHYAAVSISIQFRFIGSRIKWNNWRLFSWRRIRCDDVQKHWSIKIFMQIIQLRGKRKKIWLWYESKWMAYEGNAFHLVFSFSIRWMAELSSLWHKVTETICMWEVSFWDIVPLI